MQILDASFLLTTPLFPSHDWESEPTISEASVRGALRNWWRMLAWSEPQHARSTRTIRAAERALFGNTDSDQDCFEVRVDCPPSRPLESGDFLDAPDGEVLGPGLAYLGYGAIAFEAPPEGGHRGKVLRSCLIPPLRFAVSIVAPDRLDPSLVEAVKALGLMGGLGTRTRRGFGNVSLEQLTLREGPDLPPILSWTGPRTVAAYSEALQAVFASEVRAIPPFPAVSTHARLVMLSEHASSLALLERLGARMERYRDELRREGEPPSRYAGTRSIGRVGARGAGSSTGMGSSSGFVGPAVLRSRGRAPVEPDFGSSRRHGSLFFHVHALAESQCVAVAGIFPASDDGDVSAVRTSVRVQDWRDLDDLTLREFTQGYFGAQHRKRGEKFFPRPVQLHPYLKQLDR